MMAPDTAGLSPSAQFIPALASSAHLVEPFVAEAIVEVGRNGLEPQQSVPERRPSLRPASAVESTPRPCLTAPTAALDRILDALQHDQGVHAAERARRDRRFLGLRLAGIRNREPAAGRSAGHPGRRSVAMPPAPL
jgi:hypothetical protein